jgi:hypothetical protein
VAYANILLIPCHVTSTLVTSSFLFVSYTTLSLAFSRDSDVHLRDSDFQICMVYLTGITKNFVELGFLINDVGGLIRVIQWLQSLYSS